MKIEVKFGKKALLLRNNQFEKVLDSGIYTFFNFFDKYQIIEISTRDQMQDILNQEVITLDNISIRLSYNISYRLSDIILIKDSFDLNAEYPIFAINNWAHSSSQIEVRKVISTYNSESINQLREEVSTKVANGLREIFTNKGFELISFDVKDVNFPKNIQEIFAKELESKIRSRTDLENARTQVATARALKNASDLMKENPDIKFLHLMETFEKISQKGSKHTFVFGDLQKTIV